METVPPSPVSAADRLLPPLHVTLWAMDLERLAALRGLPPDPWPL
jgi:hypothetical protein